MPLIEKADGGDEPLVAAPIETGTFIITTKNARPDINWPAKANRRWGVKGVVLGFDSAGSNCYSVKHSNDGSTGTYMHGELLAFPREPEEPDGGWGGFPLGEPGEGSEQ